MLEVLTISIKEINLKENWWWCVGFFSPAEEKSKAVQQHLKTEDTCMGEGSKDWKETVK